MIDTSAAKATSVLGNFILVRLLAAGRSPSPQELNKALDRYFANRLGLSGGEWSELLERSIDELRRDGDIATRPLRLTESGRRQALVFLGVPSLPDHTKWQSLRNGHLIARALELPALNPAQLKRLRTADGLRAAVIARHYRLPIEQTPTQAAALTALSWKQIELPHPTGISYGKTFDRANVLRVTLLDGQAGKPEERLAALAVKAKQNGIEAVREAVICRWLSKLDASAVDEAPLELERFARRVQELATSSSTGRYGDNKVYISHVWERLRQDAQWSHMSRSQFDERLVAANRSRLLALSRADLIDGADQADAEDSKIELSHSTFHLIRMDHPAP